MTTDTKQRASELAGRSFVVHALHRCQRDLNTKLAHCGTRLLGVYVGGRETIECVVCREAMGRPCRYCGT